MTLAHASTLYFDGKKEMAKKRIQKLKAAAILRERPRHFSAPSVLFLGRKAFEILRDNGHLVDYPRASVPDLENRARVSDLTLRHELQVMDVKTSVVAAFKESLTHRLEEFSTWPALNEFRACRPNGEQVTVKPDGFVRIHEMEADGGASEYTFFLEVDRSTETLNVLCQRAHCYLDYYRAGGFAIRNGQSAEAYKDFPFRVLIICKTAERRNNIAEQLLAANPPILTQVWLTTIAESLATPLDPIWIRPIDYREVVGNSPYDVTTNHKSSNYRRNGGRDELVVAGIQKHRLLT